MPNSPEDPSPVPFRLSLPKSRSQTEWRCWLLRKPIANLPTQGPMPTRWTYGEQLTDSRLSGDGEKGGKGLYIWLLDLPDATKYRFVHVGIAAKGGSTLAERTKYHLRRQRVVADKAPGDRIHRWSPLDHCPYGTIGPDLRESSSDLMAASLEFLDRLRIMYIFPSEQGQASAGGEEGLAEELAVMEGLIARSAARLFEPDGDGKRDRWEITNTLTATRLLKGFNDQELDCLASQVASTMNDALSRLLGHPASMMPTQRRSRSA